MKRWPRFREAWIRFWHSFLDYDTKRGSAADAEIQNRREIAKRTRLENDEKREQNVLRRKETHRKIDEDARIKRMEWNRAKEAAIPRCQYCGGKMVVAYRKPNEASGCIVLILGLLLAPVLIGIPIIIFGISFMCKTEKYMKCGSCGCS